MDAKRPTQRHVGILEQRQIRLVPSVYPNHDFPPHLHPASQFHKNEALGIPSKLKPEKMHTDLKVRYKVFFPLMF